MQIQLLLMKYCNRFRLFLWKDCNDRKITTVRVKKLVFSHMFLSEFKVLFNHALHNPIRMEILIFDEMTTKDFFAVFPSFWKYWC